MGRSQSLDSNSSGTGPELKQSGVAVVAGPVRGVGPDRRGADGCRHDYLRSTNIQPVEPSGRDSWRYCRPSRYHKPIEPVRDINHDSFVFAPNFGRVTIANFEPAKDTIQISDSVFVNVAAVLAATHDDGHGNAVITDDAHDTITVQHVTTAQLLAHQGDFHFL
jgi:hypothetical protein